DGIVIVTNNFTLVSVTNNVTITVASPTYLYAGLTVNITGSGDNFHGVVVSVTNSTQFVFQVLNIVTGTAGDIIVAGAVLVICCPSLQSGLTNGGFTVPAVNNGVTVTTYS